MKIIPTIRTARDIEIFREVVSGSTLKEAGERHGIKAERARTVIHKLRMRLHHPSRTNYKLVPEGIRCDIRNMRQYSDYWLRKISLFEDELHET